MFLKFLLGLIIVAFTTLCGYLLTRKYRQRRLFFTQFREFNEHFLTEIIYSRRPIVEFVAGYSYKGEFNQLLETYFASFQTRTTKATPFPWQDSKCSFLKKEEKSLIEDYFATLGKGDSNAQKSYFSSLKDRLSSMQADAENACRKHGDLYIKIGFLCGLFILVLIL